MRLTLIICQAMAMLMLIPSMVPAQNYDESRIPDYVLPELLISKEGQSITNRSDWEGIRRPEILEQFASQVYGVVPAFDYRASYEVQMLNPMALGGKALLREVTVSIEVGQRKANLSIIIFTPNDSKGPVPLFLGMNFYGNQVVSKEESVPVTSNYVINNAGIGISNNRADESSRGGNWSSWQPELLIDRGYGLATFHCGDIDPDFDDQFSNGIHGVARLEGSPRPNEWGTIASWAWGLSRAMDYLETDQLVDAKRIALIGHSRLGKTALWAGATDERFALVISNNSGCGGAALSRRKIGETVAAINSAFPHWFCKNFHRYNDRESDLPIDQHMLIALIAPRPVYVASAAEDRWADPRGEYLSFFHAAPVYKLYSSKVKLSSAQPAIDQPVLTDQMGYHLRTGEHAVTRYDWMAYIDFADRFMP